MPLLRVPEGIGAEGPLPNALGLDATGTRPGMCDSRCCRRQPMMRRLLKFAITLMTAYLLVCALLFVFQRSLIYLPQPRTCSNGVTDFVLRVDDAQLMVSSRPRDGASAVLYFGGNAEDVSCTLAELAVAFPDHALYLLHYRGYGGSTGSPSEAALYADAVALFDQVHAGRPEVIAVGRSLGSGVAVHLASTRPLARLVLVTPFTSVQDLAARQFPWIPIDWLLKDKYESWRHAATLDVPTLIIAAEHDEVVPRASSEALFGHFRDGVASFEVIAATGHNTIGLSPDYVRLLRRGP